MEELFARFPEMQPITKPPALSSVNGFGTTVYGSRDHDAETGTYVKTLWFTFLFLPVMPLGAYRVADAPNGGWYFLGRVPLTPIAKLWPVFLVVFIAGSTGFILWNNHVRSPEYQAKKKLNEAEQLRQQGKLGDSARLYREVIEGGTQHASTAKQELLALIDSPELGDNGAAEVFKCAWEVRDHLGTEAKLAQRGITFAQSHVDQCPKECLAVLEAIEPAFFDVQGAERQKALTESLALQQTILEKMLAEQRDDLDVKVKLAVIYDATGKRRRCETLLKRHEKELGTGEGARILGQLYADQGNHEEAYALLQPYAELRLKRLQEAVKAYRTAIVDVQKAAFDDINSGKAPNFNYGRFNTLNQAQKIEMAQEYSDSRLANDVNTRRKAEAFAREASVIPIAFDLGGVQVNRARSMADQAARKAELERAEKTFLAIQEAAAMTGETKDAKLRLGEVYYWMGRQKDGKKHFDEVLTEGGNKFEVLMLVANVYRGLGAWTETRALLEKAYNTAGSEENRHQAAGLRAITQKDLDDKIAWLEKANPRDHHVKAGLAESRAQKAHEEGNDDLAVKHYREAVQILEGERKKKEDASILNNTALVYLELYQASGDPEALSEGVRMMEKAVSKDPRNAILAVNIPGIGLADTLRQLQSDKIDLKKLKMYGGLHLFAYLYQDQKEKEAIAQRLKDNAGVVRARSRLERALLLAPSNATTYSLLLELLNFLDDQKGLEALARAAEENTIEQEQSRQELLDLFQGKKDDKKLKTTMATITRAERLVNETRATGGVTFAVAVGSLITARLGLESLTRPIGPEGLAEADTLVKLAEEAHKAAPSAATAETLQSALLARAHQKLIAQVPEYAAMAKRTRRSLGSFDLIAVALWREGKAREAALANEDVKRAVNLIRDECKSLPNSPGERDWVMLRIAYPEDAKKIAETIANNAQIKIARQLRRKLSLMSAPQALYTCWALDSQGKLKEGMEILKRAAAEGVPMPFDVP